MQQIKEEEAPKEATTPEKLTVLTEAPEQTSSPKTQPETPELQGSEKPPETVVDGLHSPIGTVVVLDENQDNILTQSPVNEDSNNGESREVSETSQVMENTIMCSQEAVTLVEDYCKQLDELVKRNAEKRDIIKCLQAQIAKLKKEKREFQEQQRKLMEDNLALTLQLNVLNVNNSKLETSCSQSSSMSIDKTNKQNSKLKSFFVRALRSSSRNSQQAGFSF